MYLLLLENKNDNSHFMGNSGLELLLPGEKWNGKNQYLKNMKVVMCVHVHECASVHRETGGKDAHVSD